MEIERVIKELQNAQAMGAESVCVRVIEFDETDATSEVTDVVIRRATKTAVLVGNLDEAGADEGRDSHA